MIAGCADAAYRAGRFAPLDLNAYPGIGSL